MGGLQYAMVKAGMGASFIGGNGTFYVTDGDTGAPIEEAVIRLTGVQLYGQFYPLNMALKATNQAGKTSASFSYAVNYNATITAEGYETLDTLINVHQEDFTDTFTLVKISEEPAAEEPTEENPVTEEPVVVEPEEVGEEIQDQVAALLADQNLILSALSFTLGLGLVLYGSTGDEDK